MPAPYLLHPNLLHPNRPMSSTATSITPQQIREALEHLYANVELAHTPLVNTGKFVDPTAGVLQRAQVMRNVLLDAIEALRPLRPQPPHQLAAGRSYEVLSLRYVSCLTVEEIADRLGCISIWGQSVMLSGAKHPLAIIRAHRDPSAAPQGDTACPRFEIHPTA